MIETDVALGFKSIFVDQGPENLCPAITKCEVEQWPLGTPLIVEKHNIGKMKMVWARSMLVPNQEVSGHGGNLKVGGPDLLPFGNENLITDHKIIEIDYFDPGKLDRLIEYIKDVGSISFIISSELGQKNLPYDLYKYLIRRFQYHTTMYFNGWSNKYFSGTEDMKLGLVNIFNLPYCLPIFNGRRADGIGIGASIITKNASVSSGELNHIARVEIIFNNYEENLFVVDGSYMCEDWPYSQNLADDFRRFADQKLEYKKKSKTRKLVKEMVISPPDSNELYVSSDLSHNTYYSSGTVSFTTNSTGFTSNNSSSS